MQKNFSETSNNLLFKTKFYHLAFIILILAIICFSYANFYADSISQDLYEDLTQKNEEVQNNILSIYNSSNLLLGYMGKELSQTSNLTNEKILSIFREATNLKNFEQDYFSWVLFDWVNEKDQLTVNSSLGIFADPKNFSEQNFVKNAKQNMWNLTISEPTLGSISNVRIIPMALSIENSKYNYLGTIIVGIDINKLENKLRKDIQLQNIHFVVVDKKNNIILTSDRKLKQPSAIELANFLESSENFNEYFEEPLEIGENYYYIASNFEELNYVVFTGYKNDLIAKNTNQIYLHATLIFIILSGLFSLIVYLLHRNLAMIIGDSTSQYFQEKLDIVKFSDQAREDMAYVLQKTLQQGMENQNKLNLIKTNIHNLLSESVLICSKDSIAKNVAISMGKDDEKLSILCDQLRIKQVFISTLRQLIIFTNEDATIKIDIEEVEKSKEQFAKITFTNTNFKLIDFNTVIDKKRDDDVINNFIYLDFNQMEFFIKLHQGSLELSQGDKNAISFSIELPIEPKFEKVSPDSGDKKTKKDPSKGNNVVDFTNKKDT